MSQLMSQFRLHSVFTKIAGVLVLAFAGIGLAVGYGHMSTAEREMLRLTIDRADSESELLVSILGDVLGAGDLAAAQEILQNEIASSSGQNLATMVIDPEGKTILQVGAMPADPGDWVTMAKSAIAVGGHHFSKDGLTLAERITHGDGGTVLGTLVTQWSTEPLVEPQAEANRRDIMVATGAFALALLTALVFFSKILTGPLERLRAAIGRLELRQYDDAVPGLARKDEIGDISRSVEDLRRKLVTASVAERDALIKSAAFDKSAAAMMLIEPDFSIGRYNQGLRTLLGVHREFLATRLAGVDIDRMEGLSFDVFHPHNGAELRPRLLRLKDTSYVAELPFGDARLLLDISRISNPDGSLGGFLLNWSDVTTSSFNAALISAIETSQSKVEFSPEGELIRANGLFADALGAKPERLTGLRLHDMVQEIDGQPAAAATLLTKVREQSSFFGHVRLAVPGEKPALFDLSLSAIRDKKGALVRLLLIGKDITHQDAEIAAARKERLSAEHERNRVVEALRQGLRNLARGDLTSTIDEPFAGGFEELRSDFNGTVHILADAMREISDNAENIRNEARDISTTTDGLSRRTESTAATLEQTAAALNELTAAVKDSAEGAKLADRAVSDAKSNAEESGKVVLETVSAMDQISDSSSKITSIIKVIDDIAFQTNLLALNAGVEAARAGDAGRGFAVVASEVRALAQRSSDAAREINELIGQSAGQVRRGVDLVGKTGNALSQIVDSVSEISELVSKIASSSQQQSANLVEINQAVNQLDQSTQQNAARLEETTAASEALRNDAVALVGTVSHFSLPNGGSAEASPVLQFRSAAKAAGRGEPRDETRAEPSAPSAKARRVAGSPPAAAASGEVWQDF